MPRIYYEPFDIDVTRVTQAGAATYKADVRGPTGGVGDAEFKLADAPDGVVGALTRHFTVAGGRPAAGTGAGAAAPEVGRYLFQCIFQRRT